MQSLAALREELAAAIANAADLPALEQVRVTALGKKGKVTDLLQSLGKLPPEERKSLGAAINDLKGEIGTALETRREKLERLEQAARLARETIDVTLPARPERQGRIHPISQTIDEIVEIFASMGFALAEGPDIESDYYNFTALNIAETHPARQMHDTFYLEAPAAANEGRAEHMLLRTQTSPVQIRTMMKQKPPIRIIAPGRTYRSDSDQTHTPMFHQVEGLVIEEKIHMGHLRGCLMDFLKTFFGLDDVKLRFRPSYFPFTEPSAEVDIGCSRKGGELKLGQGSDWLEILGCGMVHPNVLRTCGLDPATHQGFAFGMGIERIAMLKYGIADLRTMFESDVRWLSHYGFTPTLVPSLAQGVGR